MPFQPQALRERLKALQKLLPEFGPYRRDQLRLKLLSAAQLAQDEADHLRRHASAFRQVTGQRPPQPRTRTPQTPEALEAEARLLETLAYHVASYRPAQAVAA